ncbi:MAG: NAD(P)-dependent oxidoreductase [Candidatus Poribacteria bacterium]|nr:NAD(P)-dependent oxidoreductase [Candidatus Poribacteria bacterium]MDE0469343.1 NAD(P)-dependent oxidoreductase [Candidatus Poribacteria bacterium]
MPIEKILITGASGYLAQFIIDRLHGEYQLTLTDLVEPDSVLADTTFIKADVTNPAEIEAVCAGQDAVVHLVALVRGRSDKPASLFADVMVKGTWNVAEACVKQGVQKLVNISSISTCPPAPSAKLPYEVGDDFQFGPGDLYYALAKYLGEQIGAAYHQAHGLDVIHVRPGVIAGDGQNPGPSAPDVVTDPWFVYVDPRDVAQCVARAVETQTVKYGSYNAVAGRADSRFSWKEAADDLGYSPEHNWPEIPGGDA